MCYQGRVHTRWAIKNIFAPEVAYCDLLQLLSENFFVQCIFKGLFAQKPNCAPRAEATPVGRFCSYAIPTEIFIILDRIPNLVELAQLFFELRCPQTDRQTRHGKNDSFEISMPQKLYFHQNLEIEFSDQCNTFSIFRIAEKVKSQFWHVVCVCVCLSVCGHDNSKNN